jgi:hypothetical protein
MRINVSARDKLAAALESVNGRATAHVMSASDVESLARRVESDLESRGVPKKARRGVRVSYRPEGPGKAYARKGRYVATTLVSLERGPSGWFMVACDRADMWADSTARYILTMPEETRAAVIAHALRDVALT